MDEEKTIVVSWQSCDCEWWTKFCDLYHTKSARVPLSLIENWVKENQNA